MIEKFRRQALGDRSPGLAPWDCDGTVSEWCRAADEVAVLRRRNCGDVPVLAPEGRAVYAASPGRWPP